MLCFVTSMVVVLHFAVEWAKQIQEKTKNEDQVKVIEAIENELRRLHEGNIARYQIRPSQYEAWVKNWR